MFKASLHLKIKSQVGLRVKSTHLSYNEWLHFLLSLPVRTLRNYRGVLSSSSTSSKNLPLFSIIYASMIYIYPEMQKYFHSSISLLKITFFLIIHHGSRIKMLGYIRTQIINKGYYRHTNSLMMRHISLAFLINCLSYSEYGWRQRF